MIYFNYLRNHEEEPMVSKEIRIYVGIFKNVHDIRENRDLCRDLQRPWPTYLNAPHWAREAGFKQLRSYKGM